MVGGDVTQSQKPSWLAIPQSLDQRNEAKLPLEIQCAIGRTLRERYGYISADIPAHFLGLWRLLVRETASDNGRAAGDRASLHNEGTHRAETLACKGPETLSILGAAFDEAWATLSSIGNRSNIAREQVARKILQLFDEGERHPGRLASRSLIKVIGSCSRA